MCIALISTSHPRYPFILINNRDEFLTRPTAPLSWWTPPHAHVLGGRDLQRSIRGTWLGMTKQGRIAVLTNFREDSATASAASVSGLHSRGGIVNSFLCVPPDSRESVADFATRLVGDGVGDVGGFSLVMGRLGRPGPGGEREGLAIVSNRTADAGGVVWIAQSQGEVCGLSNSLFGDRAWPKVVQGEELLDEAVRRDVARDGEAGDKDAFLEALFGVLSTDTLPKREKGQGWDSYVMQLRNSILIPRVGGELEAGSADRIAAAKDEGVKVQADGLYATQKQTIVLVDTEGHVTFVERTLYDEQGRETEGRDRTRKVEFDIEGWD